MKIMKSIFILGAVAISFAFQPSAYASLTLSATGVTDGFTLSLFANNFPVTNNFGPFGIATNSLGQVMIQSYTDQSIKIFNDVNGQSASTPLSSTGYSDSSYASGFARLGGSVYATNFDSIAINRLNNDGTIGAVVANVGRGGLAADPVRGTLLVANSDGIWEVDPSNPNLTTNKRFIVSGDFDGVSVSPDGQTVYGANGGTFVRGYNILSGANVFNATVGHGVDGTAVIQGASLFAGFIVANNNDGTVDLINPVTSTISEIANSGTRGDYVGFDSTDGSLFLTQTSEVYRLTCGVGCFFTPPATVPEPAPLALIGLAIAGLVFSRRTRATVSGRR